ncbi:biopolymer transporter ExbD [Thalassotalea sp. Y01]|nr:biopolymer transporter ExbD [Thalassotalea sp. Y01]
MAKKRNHINQDAGVDMTPMLDIVFIMLIFFIVTTSFVKESGLDLHRPQLNNTNSDPAKPSILVQIDNNGAVYVNNRMVDVERVSASLQFLLVKQPVSTVMISASAQTTHDVVVAVMDQIKEIEGLAIALVSK